ncbi:hypothetical protein MKX08_007380 [Trichoderma sp. CBMAI-0020]|nr:hypothetical protein MKX08_007380 [Trichoderma sp. CBMAI-0020]
MSFQNVPVLYTDDGAHFGGREYPGCFSINKVRQRLGQPLLEPHGPAKEEDRPGIGGETMTVGNHFLPNCTCAALHATCGSSHDESIYLEDTELSLSFVNRLKLDVAPSSDPHPQLAFIKRNLQGCVQQHSHSCTPLTSSYMPTRLLHISVHDGKYSLRLVEGIAPQPYVTLSHCWGKFLPAHAKTTASKLAFRKSRVLWTDLTQNCRDAVAVTERLSFQYLWIDALCIIQDSASDWASESSLRSYIVRDLSFCTDRLLALSALAKQFMVSGQARNLAKQSMDRKPSGLHARDLAKQPMAKKPSHRQPRDITKPQQAKIALADPDPSTAGPTPGRRLNSTAAYVAPSWSWASVSGVVSFAACDARAEIVSAFCHPTGPDISGQISGGEVILKAKLLPARLFRSEWKSEYSFPGVSKCVAVQADVQDPVTGKWVDAGPYHPDFIEQQAGAMFLESRRFENDSNFLTKIDGDYFAMPLAESISLILKARHTKGDTNTFERIGTIQKQKFWIGPDSDDEASNRARRQGDNPEYWRVWEIPEQLFKAVETQTVKIC